MLATALEPDTLRNDIAYRDLELSLRTRTQTRALQWVWVVLGAILVGLILWASVGAVTQETRNPRALELQRFTER